MSCLNKEPVCPYHANVLCGIWRDEKLKAMVCPGCGWNPEEEARRKGRIRLLMKRGKWVPRFYSLKHYG